MKIRFFLVCLMSFFISCGSSADEQIHVHVRVDVTVEKVVRSHVTKDLMDQYYHKFLNYIFSMRRQINYCAETIIFKGAKFRGYNDFSCKCIPISYGFFARDEQYLKKLLKNIASAQYIPYINTIIDRYLTEYPRDKNSLSRILHEEHVKHVNFGAGVNKKELMQKPELYKKLIDQNKVNLEERDACVAAGLFAQYWLEKKGHV